MQYEHILCADRLIKFTFYLLTSCMTEMHEQTEMVFTFWGFKV